MIQFNISHLFEHSQIVPSIAIYHQQFNEISVIFCTHLNDQIVLFLTIQFSKSPQFKCHTSLFDP